MSVLKLAVGQTWRTDTGKLAHVIAPRKDNRQWKMQLAGNARALFTVYHTGRFVRGVTEIHNLTEQATRVYIAGPMTGIKNKNRPAFRAAAADYRARGCFVISPDELWPEGTDPTWNEAMKVDLPAMLSCEMVVMLPGWTASKGARLEHHNARELNFAIAYPPNEIHPHIGSLSDFQA